MKATAKVAAVGSLFSFVAAMLVVYWAWKLFPTMSARLAGYALFVVLLAPVAAASALAARWFSLRRSRLASMSIVIAMLTAVVAFYLEALVLYFTHSALFGNPFSAANLFPGLVTGAIVGYARPGIDRAKAV